MSSTLIQQQETREKRAHSIRESGVKMVWHPLQNDVIAMHFSPFHCVNEMVKRTLK